DAELHVRVLPSARELLLDLLRFARLALRFQTLAQAEERATAMRVLHEVSAKDLFGFHGVARAQQRAAERLARREKPRGRFVISERVFIHHRLAQQRKASLVVLLGERDPRAEHVAGDAQYGLR